MGPGHAEMGPRQVSVWSTGHQWLLHLSEKSSGSSILAYTEKSRTGRLHVSTLENGLWDSIEIPSSWSFPSLHTAAIQSSISWHLSIFTNHVKSEYGLQSMACSVSRAKARDTAPCCCLRGSFQRLLLWWRQDSWLCCRKTFHESLWSLLERDESTGLSWALREGIRHT